MNNKKLALSFPLRNLSPDIPPSFLKSADLHNLFNYPFNIIINIDPSTYMHTLLKFIKTLTDTLTPPPPIYIYIHIRYNYTLTYSHRCAHVLAHTLLHPNMWIQRQKGLWCRNQIRNMGYPVRIELTNNCLLVSFNNYYTMQGAL